MPQFDYALYPPALLNGARYGLHDYSSLNRVNTTNAVVAFGIAIAQSPTVVDGFVLMSPGATLLGITRRLYMYSSQENANGLQGYPPQYDCEILTEGSIVVPVEEAVKPGDAVYVRHTANGAGKNILGAFRKTTDDVSGSPTVTLVTRARWLTNSQNGLAALQIDTP